MDEDQLQMEFGGVQLYNDPLENGAPPSGIIALGFSILRTAVFMFRDPYGEPPP